MRRVLIALLLATSISVADTTRAATDAEIFDQGNRAYAEGDYAGARERYEELVKAGTRDPAVFLNLGHADFQLGRKVPAAINYRRALALDPGNTAARSSLEHVLKTLGVPAPGLGAAEIVGQYISFDLLALLGSVMVWCGVGVVVFALFSTGRRPGWVFLGVIMAFAGATAVAVAWAGDSRIALAQTSMVVGDGTDARSTPADNAQKLADLAPGTPVRVVAARDDWSLVRLPIGVEGWVRTASLEPVFPGALPAR